MESKNRTKKLTTEKILKKAIKLAGKSGVQGITMRKLAASLKVEAMSLYNYYSSKDELLDALVDFVFKSVDWSYNVENEDWLGQLKLRSYKLREQLLNYPWALGLLDSRKTPGMHTLQHHDQVIKCLMSAGGSLTSIGHSYSMMDSYIYGYVMQELTIKQHGDVSEAAEELMAHFPKDILPSLYTFTKDHVLKKGYDYSDEFDVGLEVTLKGVKYWIEGS